MLHNLFRPVSVEDDIDDVDDFDDPSNTKGDRHVFVSNAPRQDDIGEPCSLFCHATTTLGFVLGGGVLKQKMRAVNIWSFRPLFFISVCPSPIPT